MSKKTAEPLIAPTFLFRFSAPCYYRKRLWSTSRGIKLEQKHVLPSFGELEGKPIFADVRAAWSEDGLAFTVRVAGKKQTAWCRESRLEESDGLRVFLDTRGVQNIHRARRFSHQFIITPFGAGAGQQDPVARMVGIRRALEEPKLADPDDLVTRSEKRIDGYLLETHIPAKALTGFDTAEHSTLGFSYLVLDRELGGQTFNVPPEFPFSEDPSLWGALELTR